MAEPVDAAMKLYGPYICKDGRRRVVVDDGIKKTTKLYARYLIEQKLGRELTSNEEVDHIDNDFTNDNLDNLQVLSCKDNRTKGRVRQVTIVVCPCGIATEKFTNYIKNNIKQGKSGPYCSRRCAAYYSRPGVAKLAVRS